LFVCSQNQNAEFQQLFSRSIGFPLSVRPISPSSAFDTNPAQQQQLTADQRRNILFQCDIEMNDDVVAHIVNCVVEVGGLTRLLVDRSFDWNSNSGKLCVWCKLSST
jgi:hypothetical protein